MKISYENVVVSTRVRLARNIADTPFPHLLRDERQAQEIVRLLESRLKSAEKFDVYYMKNLSAEKAAFLKERHLISQDLINNRRISAALISRDETISVMINEEDHVREQYFLNEFNLKKVYERISGIDDIISESIPFAFDHRLGYLTACPTNLGTGLRASVMLFLPALTRSGVMQRIAPELSRLGLTVRGAFGEGSVAEGEMYQISNEVTLGYSEAQILDVVENTVKTIAEYELRERAKLVAADEVGFRDRVLRAYGILTNCVRIDEKEFNALMSEVKLGVAMDLLDGSMQALDDLIVTLQPANINRLNGGSLNEEARNVYRAEYTGKALRGMELYHGR